MYPYRYAVSLRIRHPQINPDDITDNLGINPSRAWMAGLPRLGIKGNKLNGINEETYWTADLHKEKSIKSKKISFEDYLSKQVKRLNKSEKYFRRIRKSGGQIEFFIGLFCDKNMGVELPSALLARMSKLGIDLSLDIYPN